MEKIDQYKQSMNKFVLSELVIFLSQVLVFFMVTIFATDFLNSEDTLLRISTQKMSGTTINELGLTIIAILLVIGIFAAFGKIFEHKYVEHFVNEVLYEIPRTIYIFGSSVTGVMLAIAWFNHSNPGASTLNTAQMVTISAFTAIVMFAYGCILSIAFKRKSHILGTKTKDLSDAN